jgi:hypothetical protein
MGWKSMDAVLSPEMLVELTAAVDAQLVEVRSQPMAVGKTAMGELQGLRSQLSAQVGAIKVAVGEPTDGFLRKFARVARRDVCEEGGLLNKQWVKYQDLSRADTLAVVAGALGLMGIASPVVVAISVPITVIVLHLGLRTFCEEYGEKDKDSLKVE